MALTEWVNHAIDAVAGMAPEYTLLSSPRDVRGLVAVILVCLICGSVGSLVVGNRMAFFSDALAHCAFAGVALGLLLGLLAGAGENSALYTWGVPIIMVLFGILVGMAIAYVREKTALASDTVIGIFFAGAIGFGAMLFKALNTRTFISPENFLFGDPTWVDSEDLIVLFFLAIVTLGLLAWIYNRLVFTSFNPSLARSRQIPLRLCNYLFIIMLALIVNLSLKTVGALLINALLIVPAATAANLSRNLRQMFWTTIVLCLVAGIGGPIASWELSIPQPGHRESIQFGWAGTIVVLSVLGFFLSMAVRPWIRGQQAV